MSQPLRLFISYARKDVEYKDEFLLHLKPLVRKGVIKSWHDGDIVASEEWADEIKKNLETSDVLIFLISPAFMASDYINVNEIGKAIERHQKKEVTIVPIWIKPVADTDEFLDKFQSLPKDRKPVSQWSDHDDAWVDVVTRLKKLFERKTNGAGDSLNEHNDNPPQHSNPPIHNESTSIEQQVRNFIGRGKTKDALDKLLEYTETLDSDKHSELLLLSGRWSSIERQERLGLMTYSEVQMERNRINASLLAVLEDME